MKDKWNLWIDGKWETVKTYETLYNPHTGEVLADIAQAEPEDAERAIESAHEAYLDFNRYSAHERAGILTKVTSLIEGRREELARIISLESGKAIKNARAEIDRTIQTYRFAAEVAKHNYGERIPMDAARGGEHRLGYTKKVSLGVVTAITPFNFPSNLVAHKVGPAIAAGNAIVLKPAEQTPLSSLVLADMFKEAGLPDGVLNIITGKGERLSEMLTSHPLVQKVTFTGSVRVGHIIQKQSGFRKLTLELGSNSPLIIDKGTDIDKYIDRIVQGAFSYNGQVCISIQRIYVHDSLYDDFLKKLITKTGKLIKGSPLEEDTQITSLISKESLERIQEWMKEAEENGAYIEYGGDVQNQIMTPTILTNVSRDDKVSCQEVFGPLVSVTPFEKLDDAINQANDSEYGLNSGILTPSIENAMYASERLESGAVIVNDIPTFRIDNMPYGGWKNSGVGREGVKYAVDEMMKEKFISIKAEGL